MENIKEVLKKIEDRYKIEILFACETGSRAWGFPSPDSDYDVRFIYKHQRDWYLSLNTPKDTIEFMEGDLDITGWDIRKCLKLLKKSNVPLIERFQSPILYHADKGFSTGFMKLISQYYSPIASFYHHYSLATKFWEEIKDKEEIKLKSYFYLVRSLLSCNWIINDASVLPMHIDGLMKYMNKDYRIELETLIALKATKGERYLHPKTEKMQVLVTHLLNKIEASKNNLDVNNQDFSLLNTFFIKLINDSHDYRSDKT